MRYADTLLADGEVVVFRSRQHALALLLDARYALVAWAVTIVAVILLAVVQPESGSAVLNVLSWLGIVSFVVGLGLFLLQAWRWSAQDYVITNRRVLKVDGVLNKHAGDSSLEKINDAILDQNLLGRLLGYADLNILTAAEDSKIDDYHMLARPTEFKRQMLNAKNLLDDEAARRLPSPPVGAVVASQPAAAPPPPADPASVTRTLGELKTLVDQGAITQQEYDAKKADLLGRL
ncbi:MAG TPA: PH domain-containing protein [Candidatus Sulfotelmatobacter sp.]|nr:PH domain-containing protein [Candidatus Sulfotelmatobacter sp.]